MKRQIVSVLLALFVVLPAMAQEITEQWVKAHYNKREEMITMRDGVKLFTAIYEPKDQSQKRPILMTRTPYSCSPYGTTEFNRGLWNAMKWFAKDQYIIVFQDVRGKNMSEGQYENVRPFNPNKKGKEIDEASDTYDTVDWLVKHTHSNGNVGAFGVSYPGFYATMVGLSGHPAVKAVSPQAPVTAWFHGDDVHHNGAFMLIDSYGFSAFFDRPRQGPGLMRWEGSLGLNNDIYTDYLSMGPIANFTKALGDSIEFWPDIIAHPDFDAYWKARDPRYNLPDEVKPAVLVVGGLFDAEDLYGAWALYRAIQEKSPKTPLYLTFGPWYHGAWHAAGFQNLGHVWFGHSTADYFMKEIEYPFFSYYLDGKGEAPKVNVNMFYTGTNEWKQYPAWPLPAEQPTPLYLRADRALSFEAPIETTAYSSYTSDPNAPVPFTAFVTKSRSREYMTEDQRFAAYRPDVLSFKGEVLQDTLTLAGPVDVELEVAISSTDADFIVKLIDVFPDGFAYPTEVAHQLPSKNYPMGGYQMLVRGDVMRGKYRESFEKPVPFRPEEVTTVKFRLPDVAHTFLPGHRVMIQVQSSWFPLVDRNPQTFTNIYTCGPEAFVPCQVKIFHEQAHASKVILPVIH